VTKIASWNVNSLKARLPHLIDWLEQAKPDVVLLQETKMSDDVFPFMEIKAAGYEVEAAGQKTYNGVAVLSRRPIEVKTNRLPGGDDDPQARYLEAVTGGIRVASVYLPNGNPVDTDKFTYKLSWMARLHNHARDLLATEEPFVLGGDYNIAPTDTDTHDPRAWAGDALCRPESRAAYRRIVNLGLTDAFRAVSRDPAYSWWDYRAGAWSRDEGLRIDILLLSPQAADRLQDAGIDRTPRGWEKPSDHTPVWCDLSD